MKKRLFSWLLVLTMLLGMFPVSAMPADSITVYVSVVQNGEFVTGKDSKTIAYVPVTVSTHEPTIGDAFTVLHETYCESGLSGYETTQMSWGASVTKFWGVTSSTVGYYNNNSYAMGLTDSVTDGAHLVFWFYQDTSGWSDSYTYFDQTTASVAGGAALELTASASGLSVTVDGSAVPGKVTDANGKVTLHFAEAGTYIVSAKAPQGEYIVPPVCVVTVSDDDANAASTLASDKEALTLPEKVTENLALPAVGASGKTSVVWSTSDASIITADGKVTRYAEDKTVTLTAALTYGNTVTKQFIVTVPAVAPEELIATAKAELEKGLTISQWNEAATEKQDANIITVAQSAVNKVVSGVTVADTVTTENSGIAADGTITYPVFAYGSGAKTGNVTFTLAIGEVTESVTLNVTVPESKKSRYLAMEDAATKLPQAILNGNTARENITSNLNFTSLSTPLGCTYIKSNPDQWTIPTEGQAYLDKYGTVSRPATGEGDATFIVTCTLAWDGVSESYMEQYGYPSEYTGTIPADKTVDIELTVKAMDQDAVDALGAEMNLALANAINSIRFYTKTTAVTQDELSNITENLKLTTISGYTKNTTWTTTNPAIDVSNVPDTRIAVVTLPTDGEADSGTLTVTISKNGVSRSKAFDTIVPALSADAVQAAKDELQAVANKLTFDEIKGNGNTDPSAVTKELYLKQSAKIVDGTTELYGSNAAEYPYLIEWEITPSGFISVASDGKATFTQPTDADKAVTLKAIISRRTPIAGVSGVEKVFEIIVPAARTANTAASLEPLMDGIAAQTTATTNWESFLAMAAYEDTRPSVSKLTEAAKQNMLNSSLNAVSATNPDEDAYAKAILDMQSIGVNPRELYPVNRNTPVDAVAGLNGKAHSSAIWTAAYTLLAYQQGGYSTGTQEADVVTALLGTQLESGGWTSYGETAEADATGLAIQALAAYYDTNSSVKTAVDKAIRYLSEIQLDNGGFGGTWGENANNAACVIMGLCAMGINPDTDSRFIKNGYSVLDALLAYAVEDNSGFALSIGGEQVNGYATQQGFPALVAAYQVVKTGQAFNVYDFSRNTLSPGRATGAGTVSAPENPSGNSITVTLTIKSDTDYWLNSKTVTIPGTGATVYHALIEALKGSGITQTGAASGYVEAMTKGGQTLAEFTNGKDSGWMYKVNGELPEVGLTDCDIANGDTIVWFYTNDWTTVPGATSSFGGTKVSEEDLAAACEVKGLITAIGTVTEKSGDAIKAAREAYDTLTDTQKELVPNYDDLLEAEKKYAELAGKTLAFADVNESDYFYQAVKWAAEMGITSGTSETTFSPHASCTRAQMVTFLWRAAGTPESAGSETSFGDVDKEAYYYKALLWAVEAGITSGTSATTFSPDAVCTRGQMAMFLYRSAKSPNVNGSNSFTDVDYGVYYKEAVIWAKNEDITTGTSATTFSPDAACTRAQMVTFLYRYLSK